MKTIEPDSLERQRVEAAQRDPAEFEALYELNFDRVYAYLARRVSTREEAEDLTAEVFQEALRSLPTFRWQGAPFIAWLLGIAAHLLARRWRAASAHELPVEEVDLEDLTRDAERQSMVSQCVDRLPGDQRHVIVRRFIHQYSIREIANELGRSEGAIKQLQLRALETLRGLLRSSNEQRHH